MPEAAANFDNNFDGQIQRLHEAKAAIAPGLVLVVKKIVETGNNPENLLKDVIKLARILDISAPAQRHTTSSFTDPRYNLIDYLKRSSGSSLIREIDADEVLFDKNKPFTCISQIQEIFEDTCDKIARNFVPEVEYA